MKYILLLFAGTLLLTAIPMHDGWAQSREERLFREYTNPDELVTFDRSTEFVRALDVINDFSQEYKGKVILDKTGISGNIGISIPPMHWQDALNLMLNVKGRALVERPEFFEIVENIRPTASQGQAGASQQGGKATSANPEDLLLSTKSREVRINAIFFEGNRRALQEIGVDWSTLTRDVPENIGSFVSPESGGGGGGGGGGSGSGGGTLPSPDFEGPFVQVNSKGAQSVSQNVFNSLINLGEIGNTGIRVQALFSAFEADNLGEVLASPSIKVLEGQEGDIQVGEDFSIKQRDIAGNVTDNFVSVGTILTVTPQVITYNDTTFIHLDLEAERSSAQPDPVSTVIKKQEATTQALLMDGEATVIAGLYRTEQSEVRRGIPILKDLPPWLFGLRYLFGYNSKTAQMSELVIIVQASIEPTVPERYGKKGFASKFELLRDERDRTRREMLQQEEKTSEVMDPIERDNYDAVDEETTAEPEPEPQPQHEDPFDAQDEQIENNPEKEKPEEPVITDPEVNSNPIELDFADDTTTNASPNGEDAYEDADKAGPAETDEPETTTDQLSNTQPVDSEGYGFYLIGGSFKNRENAVKFRDQLSDVGFSSQILRNSNADTYMVTYGGYNDIEMARKALADIREVRKNNAWLYRAE